MYKLKAEALRYMAHQISVVEKPVILELGSCNGEDTEMLLSWSPKTTLYGFEPDPRNVERMKRTDLLSRIHFYEDAVGHVTGEIPFHLSSADPKGEVGSSSISQFTPELTRRWSWLNCIDQITVQCWRLDDFCREHSIDHIDLIWMDVQGAERLVFDGARETLNKTGLVWTEYDDGTLYKDSSNQSDILTALKGWQIIANTGGTNTGGDMLLENPTYKQ